MTIVFLHLLIVEGDLPRPHVPANCQDLGISHLHSKAEEHDDTFLTMAHGQVVVAFLPFSIDLGGMVIARGLADVMKQRGDNQRVVAHLQIRIQTAHVVGDLKSYAIHIHSVYEQPASEGVVVLPAGWCLKEPESFQLGNDGANILASRTSKQSAKVAFHFFQVHNRHL